ncbi:MAG: heavy metal translocating P-type ATPase [Lachnospiraceae bacterium]|nr:heavy metal translocating P-type ATPase [Lachnospiraceae bacterium]
MQQYNVTGMSCAACSARVEKAVGRISGVDNVSVSLLTNSMIVEGEATPESIMAAVTEAGYGASIKGLTKNTRGLFDEVNIVEDELRDTETPKLIKRFILSIIFLLPLMYVSMGHIMWSWPLPAFVEDSPISIALIQLLFTIIIMIINQKFFVSGVRGVMHGAPNMDTLVALGSGASFIYSVYGLFAISDAVLEGNLDLAHSHLHDLYFESAAMILALITLGKTLEAYSKGKTTDALKGLMKLAPKSATVIRDGVEQQLSIEQVVINDIFVVKPGESIPVDGVVIEGHSAIDESALTGESIPVDKEAGASVYAATINQSGYIKCRATHVGQDTTLSQIIQMVKDAATTKAPIAKVADKVSGVFVPIVILLALITCAVWMLVGKELGFALARAISVLVISCPCALGLATPVAIMVGNGVGAKKGILFKTAASLEATGKVNAIALDKTGTITMGKPVVTDIIPVGDISKEALIAWAYGIEKQSEHPLGKAIVEYWNEHKENIEKSCNAEQISSYGVEDFQVLPGNGLIGTIDGKQIIGGNLEFIISKTDVTDVVKKQAKELSLNGKTPLLFARDGELLGLIAVADVIKPDSIEAIELLKNMGIHVVMLTGDNEQTAKAIGEQVKVDQIIAGVKPDGKEEAIGQLKSKYKLVAMVGDGINDAPALTRADIGIAIGAGTDVAIDAADVVLMKNSIKDVAVAVALSRAVLKNIHQNLFWAFCYNVIGIPLAAGVWIPLFGWQLNPMFGAAAMSLSSFCVVTNALRLNYFKTKGQVNSSNQENTDNNIIEIKGDNAMEKTMKIEGMMCGHCEARVKKVLEALPQVDEAIVSHVEGTAVLKLNADITNDELKKIIEDQDYKVVEVV